MKYCILNNIIPTENLSLFWISFFYLKCLSGLSKVLMRLTIQLKRRPYSALAMASLTSVAFSTVLGRIIVSPRVTTQWEVRASCNSSAWIHSKDAPRKNDHRHSSEACFGRKNTHLKSKLQVNVLSIRAKWKPWTITNEGIHTKQLCISNLVTNLPSFHCSLNKWFKQRPLGSKLLYQGGCFSKLSTEKC